MTTFERAFGERELIALEDSGDRSGCDRKAAKEFRRLYEIISGGIDALDFYASKKNYKCQFSEGYDYAFPKEGDSFEREPVFYDKGERARRCLKKIYKAK